MRRLALRFAQRAMLLTPARERRQPQAPRDDAIDMLEQQHFGEQVLVLRARCSSRTASSPICSSSTRGTVFLYSSSRWRMNS